MDQKNNASCEIGIARFRRRLEQTASGKWLRIRGHSQRQRERQKRSGAWTRTAAFVQEFGELMRNVWHHFQNIPKRAGSNVRC